MRTLAAFVMRDRASAILVVVLLSLGSAFLSLLGLGAAAALALPTLRRGYREGLVIGAGALAAVAVAGWLMLGTAVPVVIGVLFLWLPVWLVSLMLRETGNLAAALTAAAGVGTLAVAGFYLTVDDPGAFWIEVQAAAFRSGPLAADPRLDSLSRSFSTWAPYLTGFVAAGLVLSVVLSVLLARWWQSELYNPGGFRAEFLSLRLPQWPAYLGLALAGVALLAPGGPVAEIPGNLILILSVVFLLAGLAILHSLLSRQGHGRFWLTGVYLMMLFIAPLAVLVMLLGFSDTWIDWRNRFARA